MHLLTKSFCHPKLWLNSDKKHSFSCPIYKYLSFSAFYLFIINSAFTHLFTIHSFHSIHPFCSLRPLFPFRSNWLKIVSLKMSKTKLIVTGSLSLAPFAPFALAVQKHLCLLFHKKVSVRPATDSAHMERGLGYFWKLQLVIAIIMYCKFIDY